MDNTDMNEKKLIFNCIFSDKLTKKHNLKRFFLIQLDFFL